MHANCSCQLGERTCLIRCGGTGVLASRQTSQLRKCFCLSLQPKPENGSAQHLLVFLAENANQH